MGGRRRLHDCAVFAHGDGRNLAQQHQPDELSGSDHAGDLVRGDGDVVNVEAVGGSRDTSILRAFVTLFSGAFAVVPGFRVAHESAGAEDPVFDFDCLRDSASGPSGEEPVEVHRNRRRSNESNGGESRWLGGEHAGGAHGLPGVGVLVERALSGCQRVEGNVRFDESFSTPRKPPVHAIRVAGWFSFLLIAGTLWMLRGRPLFSTTNMLMGAFVVLSAFTCVASLYSVPTGRYAFMPGVVFLLVLLKNTETPFSEFHRHVCMAVLAYGLATGVVAYQVPLFQIGPSWAGEVAKWEADPELFAESLADALCIKGQHHLSETQEMNVKPKWLIFVPTYNEAENVGVLFEQIRGLKLDADVLFLDDNSPDGTGQIIDRIAAESERVYTIHRTGKLGIGSAHVTGIQWAYERATNCW